MDKRTHYTRSEIEQVIYHIKELDKKYVDVSDEKSYLRQVAGQSEGDFNMYLLLTELERRKISTRLECSEWIDGKGYQKVDGFWLTDTFYLEMIGRPVSKNNQINIFKSRV